MSRSRGTALLTGATGGIGRELARIMSADGWRTIAAARDTQALRELVHRAETNMEALPVDLAAPDAAARICEQLDQRQVTIDMLVNCAGFKIHSPFSELQAHQVRGLLQVNLFSPVELTHIILGSMLCRGEGRILNIASTAAFRPAPSAALYHAAKAFLLQFSEALHEETRGTGVTVTCVCPGTVYTGFIAKAGAHTPSIARLNGLTPHRVAANAYRAAMRGTPLVIPGTLTFLMVQAGRFMPRALVRRIMRTMAQAEAGPDPDPPRDAHTPTPNAR